jgi:large subunit ribosomal protein L30
MSAAATKKKAGKTLRVTQRKSGTGFSFKQKRTLKALGLAKIGRTREFTDGAEVRGMLARISHLVEVEEC